jgi:putative mycofactocin binding protein MftB
MAYHYDNRRLNFLRSFDLVDLVNSLEHHPSADAALRASTIDPSGWHRYQRALASLAASDFLEQREPDSTTVDPIIPDPEKPDRSEIS